MPDCYLVFRTNSDPGYPSPTEVLRQVGKGAADDDGWLDAIYFDREKKLAHVFIGYLERDREAGLARGQRLAEQLGWEIQDVTWVESPHELES